MTEQEYLERRIAEELAAATASRNARAAQAHFVMAEAYRLRLQQTSTARRAA